VVEGQKYLVSMNPWIPPRCRYLFQVVRVGRFPRSPRPEIHTFSQGNGECAAQRTVSVSNSFWYLWTVPRLHFLDYVHG